MKTMLTSIKSEVYNLEEMKEVTAKVVILEDDDRKELFLSELNEDPEEEEEDHLHIQVIAGKGIYINGKAVNKRITEEIIRFLAELE